MKKRYFGITFIIFILILTFTGLVACKKDDDEFVDPNSDIVKDSYIVNSIDYLDYDYTSEEGIYYFGAKISFQDSSTLEGYAVVRLDGCTDENIVIPDVVNGKRVVAIYGEDKGSDAVKTISIPKNVLYIAGYVLSSNRNLESITISDNNPAYKVVDNCVIQKESLVLAAGCSQSVIPDGVLKIEDGAFYGCVNLYNVTIPDSVLSIGYAAFKNCEMLSEMTIPFVGGSATAVDGEKSSVFGYIFGKSSNEFFYTATQRITVTETEDYSAPKMLSKVTVTQDKIPYGAFSNFSRLQIVVLPDSLTKIKDYTFYNCSKINTISIPENVEQIGEYSFYNCMDIEDITIPEKVTIIKQATFYGCSKITSIDLSKNVTEINKSAFAKCINLVDVKLSDKITYIGSQSFQSCSSLIDFKMYDSVLSLGLSVFENCTSLVNVVLSNQLSLISYGTFSGCSKLTTIDCSNVTNISNTAFENCVALTNIVLSENLINIGNYAFSGCESLQSVELSNKLTTIGNNAFEKCKSITEIVIPDSVSFVGFNCFSDCIKLKDVTIGKSVSNITTYMFGDCIALENVIIPNSISMISAYAFLNCEKLKSVSLSNNVNSIGAFAFKDCKALSELVIPNSVKSIGSSALSGCISLSKLTIPFVGTKANNVDGSIDSYFGYIFGDALYESSFKLDQYSSETEIFKTFYVPAVLHEVTITKGVINSYVMSNCKNLTKIQIGNEVTYISPTAFSRCLDSIYTISNNVKYFGNEDNNYAWITGVSDNNLSSYILNESAIGIMEGAFKDCVNLASITIPNSVNSIGEGAFNGCSNLNKISIPFVGANKNSLANTKESIFGYIFGLESYLDSVVIKQNYSDSKTYNACLPASLKTVDVTGGDIKTLAFNNCDSIIAINLYDGVTSIGYSAFNKCIITSLVIPKTVTSIAAGALNGCSYISSLELPFVGESRLESQASEKTLFGYIFGTESYFNATDVTYQNYGTSVTKAYNIPTTLTEVTFTGSKLYNGAFSNCNNIRLLRIDNNLELIGDNALFGTNINYSIDDGNMYLGNSSNEYLWLINSNTTNSTTTIKDGCIGISYSAFESNSYLTEITIPSSVKYIMNKAFSNCSSLVNLSISTDVSFIGKEILSGTSSLESLTIPFLGDGKTNTPSINTISYLFGSTETDGATKITQKYSDNNSIDAYIPNSLNSITINSSALSKGALSGLIMLKNVSLSTSIEEIPDYFFMGCENLVFDFTPYVNLTKLGKMSFKDCYKFTNLVVPDTITSIDDGAFNGCKNITDIELPFVGSSVSATNVSNSTLFGYVFGTSLYEGATATSQSYTGGVGSKVYQIPTALKNVTINSGYVFSGAFSNCANIEKINIAKTSTDNILGLTFNNCKALKNLTYSSSVLTISNNAFNGCSNITSFNILSSIMMVYNNAFSNCENLIEFVVADENVNYSSIDGVLYNKDKTTLVLYPVAKENEIYSVVDTCTTLGSNAFTGNKYLDTVKLPVNLSTIGTNSFNQVNVSKLFINNESLSTSASNIGYIYNIDYLYVLDSLVVSGYLANHYLKSSEPQTEVGYDLYLRRV